MDELTTKEQLQKISAIQLNLNLSDKGDLSLSGEVNSDDIQPILDASHLRYSLYLQHQKELSRESNLTAIYIGVIFSTLLGLAVFCLFNQSPKVQTQSNLGEFKNGIAKQLIS